MTYSAVEMRTPNEENKDVVKPGTSIPFVALNINAFKKNNYEELSQSITYVAAAANYIFDNGIASTELASYFSNTKSKGSYLIAEEYVNKIVNEEMQNNTIATRLGDGSDPGDARILGYLSDSAANFDPVAQTLTVRDSNNLSHDEKRAILAVRTANTSFNSFASENEFHAVAVRTADTGISITGNFSGAGLLATYIKKSAISSDTGVGEEGRWEKNKWTSGFFSYNDSESESVSLHRYYHGDG